VQAHANFAGFIVGEIDTGATSSLFDCSQMGSDLNDWVRFAKPSVLTAFALAAFEDARRFRR
jgi:hypothetical protein